MAFAIQPMFRRRSHFRSFVATVLAGMVLVGAPGCSLIFPDVSHQPVIHNPFPQLNKVAVAPFFNQSDEPTVDGRKFALAYFAELQAIPGFEVVPLGVVENAIIEHQVDLSRPNEARRLANILGVDAVVIGSVTDYTPYYPPRCGLHVEWYAANPGFHEIPPGYGLPWGTPEEEYIPAPLVFESEFALAKAQLATQSPACDRIPIDPPAEAAGPIEMTLAPGGTTTPPVNSVNTPRETGKDNSQSKGSGSGNSSPTKSPSNKTGDSGRQHGIIRALYEERNADEELPMGDSTATSAAARIGPRCCRRYDRFHRRAWSARSNAGKLARRARVHSASAKPGASALLPLQWSDYDAHAGLSRQRQRIHRSARQLLSLPRRRSLRRLAKLLAAQRRLHPLLLSYAHQRDALGAAAPAKRE